MATYDSDDEIRRSPLLEPQTILYGPSTSPPPVLSDTPLLPRLGSQNAGQECWNWELRPSQGDQVLISHLAPNYLDIARIAGEYLLSTEPDPEDEEDGEAYIITLG